MARPGVPRQFRRGYLGYGPGDWRRIQAALAGGPMRWVQVTWGQAQFALGIDGGMVAEAPPLAKWAVGVAERQAAAWFRQRGASFAVLDGPHPPRIVPEPGVYWWCEHCHGSHTMDGIQACRRDTGSAPG